MGTPNLFSASLGTLTGSDNATGSINVYFSEKMVEAPSIEISNYNFTPSLTIASASAGITPAVWFKMDEGTGTSVTSSNGLYSGSFQAGSTALSWESGSYSTGSYSIFFDQSTDYITPPNAIWPTAADDMVTVAFWARARGDVADDLDDTIIFDAVDASNGRNFTFHQWSDGIMYFDCGNGWPTDRLTYDWGASHKDNTQWHHWALTKKISTGQMRIYLDGTDVANSTGNTDAWAATNTTRIAGNYSNSYLWAGNLSDFAIWNTELSASDIATLYNDGSGSSPGLLSSSNLTVLYPFQEGAGSTCYDKSGNSRDGTITNSHWAYADPTPQPRTFVEFPGDGSSYINCGHHPSFGTGSSSGPMSVSAWVRYNNDPGNYSAFVQVATNSSWGDGWGLFWVSNYFKFYIQHYSSNAASFAADGNFAVKQWNHVVGTWDNSTIKIYVNGVEGTSDSYSGVMSTKGNDLIIGQGKGGYVTDATIDDVRIYAGTTLTQAEVTDLYNKRNLSPDPKTVDLTVTGLNTSQGYILDVNSNIVSSVGGNSCVPNSASFISAVGRQLNNDSTFFQKAGEGQVRTWDRDERDYGEITDVTTILSDDRITIGDTYCVRDITETQTTSESLIIKYFQRVYDAGTAGWCYYTKTTIDATPEASETTPNYTGAISLHSVVQILEVY